MRPFLRDRADELVLGVRATGGAPRRRDGARRSTSRTRDEGLSTVYGRVLQEFNRATWTDEVSARFGDQKAKTEKRGQHLEDFDLAIAAHALAEGHVLVTANSKHMIRLEGLETEDWLEDGG